MGFGSAFFLSDTTETAFRGIDWDLFFTSYFPWKTEHPFPKLARGEMWSTIS